MSRFTKEKNVSFVFDVFKHMPENVRLTLVGYGQEYDALRYQAFNELHFSHERVRFVHKPDQSTLLELYRCADLFLFPSHNDTQGIVIAEALSQGLPVIAVDGPGQRDSIRTRENGFIITDAMNAVEIIKNIMNNAELHAYLRCNAYETGRRYAATTHVQHLLSFYEMVKIE